MADCATNFTLSCVNGGGGAGMVGGAGVAAGGGVAGGAGGVVTGLPGVGDLTPDLSEGGAPGALPVRPRVSSF
jgi:hypothetical protein